MENSVEITEISVNFSKLKLSVKFSGPTEIKDKFSDLETFSKIQ